MVKLHAVALVTALSLPLLAQDAKPTLPDSVAVEANIPYGEYKETVLDVYQPKAAADQKRPGVIVIQGGGWVGGTKDDYGVRVCSRYVEKGFVCASVEYRLAKVAPAPAAVTDVLNAARWFDTNAKKYHVDTKRMVVTGGSAGGHLSLMVGMTPGSAKLGPAAKVAAVRNFFRIPHHRHQPNRPQQQDHPADLVARPEGPPPNAPRLFPHDHVPPRPPPIPHN